MPKTPELSLPDIEMREGMTTQDYAYQRLRNAILLGAIAPGTNLTIRGLAGLMDLSPTPLREAVRRLSSEHGVEVLGNRRLRVPVMEPGRFEELIALRVTLETHAATRALPHVSGVIIERMRQVDEQMDVAVEEGRLEDLTHLNHRFHRTLYVANPDQQVMPLIESVWLQLGPFHRQVVRQVKEYYRIDRHKELTAALETRDVQALQQAVTDDITDGLTRAGREMLRSQGAEMES